jgi:hypothetical protein
VRLERFRDAKPNSQVDSSRKIVVGLWIHRANETILFHTAA